MGPSRGPIFGSVHGRASQATAYFQWVNAAVDAAPSCRPPLIINMDETAIVRHVSGLRGTVLKATSQRQLAVDRAPLSERRSCISLLACITHDAAIQAQLPQVLLGNEHVFTLQLLQDVGTEVGKVFLWRQKSSWNCHATMRKWLSLLAKALGPVVQERYVIVVLDVHPSHIHSSIFLHARRCGLRLVYIPAKLTSFLQPCDTHVFARFKSAVRSAWREQKSRAPRGTMSTGAWLAVARYAIEKVLLETTWRKAFLADGLLRRQQNLSPQLLVDLGFDGPVDVPKVLPTTAEASSIFPSRVKVDILSYLLWQTKTEQKKNESMETMPLLEASSSSSSARRPLPPTFAMTRAARKIRTLE